MSRTAVAVATAKEPIGKRDRSILKFPTSIPLDKSLEILRKYATPTGVEQIAIADSCQRIVADNLLSPFPIPPFTRSPLDGFALRAEDTTGASREHPVSLRITQTVFAGEVPARQVVAGETTAVTTGTLLPEGCDAVIKFEDVSRNGETIFIGKGLRSGENVVPKGEDIAAGETILQKGAHITPAAVGLIASLGMQRVPVYKKPKVAVFSIGDELLESGQPLGLGKIYNSNLHTLCAQIWEAGGTPAPRGTLADDRTAIAKAINKALPDHDMIITTGGASVGSKDLIKDAITQGGATTLFWKIGMKPGTPAVCAEKNGKLIVGLSGNPSAAMITFIMLVRPILRAMAGRNSDSLQEVTAVMESPFGKPSKQRRLLRAVLTWKEGGYAAVPAGIQSPGALKSMLLCNALIDIPAGHGPLEMGEQVRALLLPPSYCL